MVLGVISAAVVTPQKKMTQAACSSHDLRYSKRLYSQLCGQIYRYHGTFAISKICINITITPRIILMKYGNKPFIFHEFFARRTSFWWQLLNQSLKLVQLIEWFTTRLIAAKNLLRVGSFLASYIPINTDILKELLKLFFYISYHSAVAVAVYKYLPAWTSIMVFKLIFFDWLIIFCYNKCWQISMMTIACKIKVKLIFQ